jgi:hypothetical protein
VGHNWFGKLKGVKLEAAQSSRFSFWSSPMSNLPDEQIRELEQQIASIRRSKRRDTLAWIGIFVIMIAAQITFGWLAFDIISKQQQEIRQLQLGNQP